MEDNEILGECIKCKKRYFRDEITFDGICIDCYDNNDYLAEMQIKRQLED